MAESYLDNPIVVGLILVGMLAIIVYAIFGKRIEKIKDLKIQKTEETIEKDFKEKIKKMGHKIKHGKLILGVNNIAKLDRWLRIQGKFDEYFLADKTQGYQINEDAERVPYDLLIFLAKNKFFLFRWLGIKKYFFLIQANSLLRFDEVTNSFILKENTDLVLYADVWVNSQSSIEYIHDISIKRMNIELMTALENYPNKVVHLEMAQAKKERTYREMMETDKARYDAIKKAEDTVIS